MFNDMIVVDSAPDPYNPLSPYEYMDESGISWVTGEIDHLEITGQIVSYNSSYRN